MFQKYSILQVFIISLCIDAAVVFNEAQASELMAQLIGVGSRAGCHARGSEKTESSDSSSDASDGITTRDNLGVKPFDPSMPGIKPGTCNANSEGFCPNPPL